jgi:signal transduction histidine kinase/ActR/RegA family two-component response regulator
MDRTVGTPTCPSAAAAEDGNSARVDPGLDRVLSEAVAMISGGVADALSNPLTNLVSRLELMMAEAGEREGQSGLDDLDVLHQNARRLVRVVETLRSCSGDAPNGVRLIRLNQVVSRAQAAAGVSPSVLSLDPTDPVIAGDAARLEALVAAGLASAGRAPGEGGGRVETRSVQNDTPSVVLEISGVAATPELIASASRLASEHFGALDVRPMGDRAALTLTFPPATVVPFLVRGGEGLRRIARQLVESSEGPDVAQRVAESLLPLFRAESASAWLRRLDGSLACVARTGRGAERLGVGDVLPRAAGAAGDGLEHRALWAAALLEATKVWRADERGPDGCDGNLHAAVVAVPLIVTGEVIGALVMRPAGPGGLAEAELDLLRTFADEVAPAMRNGQLVMQAETARAAAEAAGLARDESLAILAHEFRNALAPIMTSAALIRRLAPPGGVVHDSADTVKRQARHLARLLDDLLDVSRMADGKVELRSERLSLGTVLEQAVEAARRDGDRLGLAIALSLPPAPVWIEADPTRLEQIVANLLANAVKYTTAGGRIEVTATADGREAVVEVRDTGIGILPELLSRLFEPFFRSPQAREHTPVGLGIGLTLVRQLVELHGGRVGAHSEGPGRGSTFTVRLPLGAGAEPPTPVAAAVASPQVARDVLIIDDHADTREMLSALLAYEGHRVHVAGDAAHGLARDEELRPDVVLVDIELPGLSGYEVARRIRARRGAVPLIAAITGQGRPEDRHRSFEAGFDAHLTKPVLSDDLLRVIGVFATRAPAAGEPGRAG